MYDLINWLWIDGRLIDLPLVMLNKTNNAFLLGGLNECLVVLQRFCGGLRDQNMHSTLNGVQSNWVMGSWRILSH
jgi:hypothetical protein